MLSKSQHKHRDTIFSVSTRPMMQRTYFLLMCLPIPFHDIWSTEDTFCFCNIKNSTKILMVCISVVLFLLQMVFVYNCTGSLLYICWATDTSLAQMLNPGSGPFSWATRRPSSFLGPEVGYAPTARQFPFFLLPSAQLLPLPSPRSLLSSPSRSGGMLTPRVLKLSLLRRLRAVDLPPQWRPRYVSLSLSHFSWFLRARVAVWPCAPGVSANDAAGDRHPALCSPRD